MLGVSRCANHRQGWRCDVTLSLMTTLTTESLTLDIGAEFRAELGRRGLSQAELARRMGTNGTWISTRISPSATVEMTVIEIANMAWAIGVEPEEIVAAALQALRARRDSNPKPSDLEFWRALESVNRPLTLDRRYRDAWELAS